MSIVEAMSAYAITDKQRFPSYNGADDSIRPSTTFWADFCVADAYGYDAIKDTFFRSFRAYQKDVKFFTELTIILNHKLWYYFEHGDNHIAHLYDALWKKADAHAKETFQGDDAKYYFTVTD